MDKYFSKDIKLVNIADLTKPFKNRDVLTVREILIVDSVIDSLKKIKETQCVRSILNLLNDLSDGNISKYHKYNNTNFLYIEECILGTDVTVYFSEHNNHFKILDIEFNSELCA